MLKEFNITILDWPRNENLVVYFLSRINNEGEVVPVEESFLDEILFAISTQSPWFVDIVNYFFIGKLPQHFSPRYK
jgi:hypothetical protein